MTRAEFKQWLKREGATLERQLKEWPNHLKGAVLDNPYTTLCGHCYGRHAPPRDEICQHDEPSK